MDFCSITTDKLGMIRDQLSLRDLARTVFPRQDVAISPPKARLPRKNNGLTYDAIALDERRMVAQGGRFVV